ncbi:MAG TPA: hypothetical protein VEY12_04890, partial [Thermoplasmata archaeon]|nr:hypothetical protein [Thermoplasmata archaeon]
MVDRVYKAGVPALRKDLERLRESFAQLDSRTDWVKLRIEPLLDHVKSLERLLVSREHAREFSRLTRGVAMFHSDLVYFRTNVQALEKILEPERKG